MNTQNACDRALANQEWGELRALSLELLAGNSESAEANYLHGLACFRCLDLSRAEEHLCKAIHLAPGNAAPYTSLVQLLACDKRFSLAQEIADEALKRCQPAPQWLSTLADPLSLFNPSAALAIVDQVLDLDPSNSSAACTKLELLLAHSGRMEAQSFVHDYASRFPEHANVAVLRAVLAEHGNDDILSAREIYQSALAEFPNDLGIRFNLARITGMQGDLDRQRKILAPHRSRSGELPASEVLLAESLFKAENYSEAFYLYENRGKVGWRPLAPIPTTPKWQGESLADRRILIVYEQGYGDALLGSRYIPHLIAKASRDGAAGIGMLCHHQLYAFFAHSRLCSDIDLHFEFPLPGQYDCHIPILSIPERLALDSLPPSVEGDFQPSPFLKRKWGEILGVTRSPRLGIIWKSVSNARNASEKSLSEQALMEIVSSLPDMEWIACAPGIGQPPLPEIRDVSMQICDFADTAALFMQLDGIVSIDTGPAHLAGCLKLPQILLSQAQPDWRWTTDKTTRSSVWHPETTVVRQSERGNWESVIAPAVEAIRQLLGCKASRRGQAA